MSLSDLPNSVVTIIAHFLNPPLSSYAVLSREWQEAIEAQTFRKLHLSTSSRIDTFSQVVMGSRRRRIHRLNLEVELPSYNAEACARAETPEEQEGNNEAFTRSIACTLGY